jgi:riboflavin biosynthesis pyrimidine reductase
MNGAVACTTLSDSGDNEDNNDGLIDECHFFLTPVVVGGGTSALPDNVRLQLELLDERRFGNGVVHLYYRVAE